MSNHWRSSSSFSHKFHPSTSSASTSSDPYRSSMHSQLPISLEISSTFRTPVISARIMTSSVSNIRIIPSTISVALDQPRHLDRTNPRTAILISTNRRTDLQDCTKLILGRMDILPHTWAPLVPANVAENSIPNARTDTPFESRCHAPIRSSLARFPNLAVLVRTCHDVMTRNR